MGSDGKQELPGASSWVEQIISRNVELKLKHTGEEAVIILINTIKLYKEIIITEMQCRESNHFFYSEQCPSRVWISYNDIGFPYLIVAIKLQ